MSCPKAGSVVFLGLVLMTAGFVLTLAGWFAPPIREAVLRVRLAGPVSLLVGLFLLGVSCCVCAFQQRKCCSCCYPAGTEIRDDHTQLSPLLLREMRQAMDRVSTGTASAGCSTSSLPQHDPRQIHHAPSGSSSRNHRKSKRRPPASPTSVRYEDDNRGPCRSAACRSDPYRHAPPRPASVLIPRSALYQETYLCHGRPPSGLGAATADYKHQVKVTVQPLPPVNNCKSPTGSTSPTNHHNQQQLHQAAPISPTVYLRNYTEDIVSAL